MVLLRHGICKSVYYWIIKWDGLKAESFVYTDEDFVQSKDTCGSVHTEIGTRQTAMPFKLITEKHTELLLRYLKGWLWLCPAYKI